MPLEWTFAVVGELGAPGVGALAPPADGVPAAEAPAGAHTARAPKAARASRVVAVLDWVRIGYDAYGVS
jgi:hypothetical protein